MHWLRVLKRNELNIHGLKITYLSKIRSVLTYAAPAWYNFLSTKQKDRIERIQKIAIKYILPGIEYEVGLQQLKIPKISDLVTRLQLKIFNDARTNDQHPLHSRIPTEIAAFSQRETRGSQKLLVNFCKTAKYNKSFINDATAKYNSLL